MPLATIPEAIDEFKAGRPVIIVDDEDRENEGDLAMAAEKITPEWIAFMAKTGGGLICMPCIATRLDELDIEPMVSKNTSNFGTAFSVSIEAKHLVTTGISAYDRAATIRHVLDPTALSRELLGHQVDGALRRADPFGHHPTIRRVTLRLIQRQQHPGPGDHPGRMPTRRHHLGQLPAVARFQADRELLGTRHDVNSLWSSINQKSGPHITIKLGATRH